MADESSIRYWLWITHNMPPGLSRWTSFFTAASKRSNRYREDKSWVSISSTLCGSRWNTASAKITSKRPARLCGWMIMVLASEAIRPAATRRDLGLISAPTISAAGKRTRRAESSSPVEQPNERNPPSARRDMRHEIKQLWVAVLGRVGRGLMDLVPVEKQCEQPRSALCGHGEPQDVEYPHPQHTAPTSCLNRPANECRNVLHDGLLAQLGPGCKSTP